MAYQNFECKNDYSEEDYNQNFFVNESEQKKCMRCPYLSYDSGIAFCSLFNKEED